MILDDVRFIHELTKRNKELKMETMRYPWIQSYLRPQTHHVLELIELFIPTLLEQGTNPLINLILEEYKGNCLDLIDKFKIDLLKLNLALSDIEDRLEGLVNPDLITSILCLNQMEIKLEVLKTRHNTEEDVIDLKETIQNHYKDMVESLNYYFINSGVFLSTLEE